MTQIQILRGEGNIEVWALDDEVAPWVARELSIIAPYVVFVPALNKTFHKGKELE